MLAFTTEISLRGASIRSRPEIRAGSFSRPRRRSPNRRARRCEMSSAAITLLLADVDHSTRRAASGSARLARRAGK
jgi:hypothetical protein